MKQSLKRMWMVGGALVATAAAGCTSEDEQPRQDVVALHATTGAGEAIALRGIAVDHATYAQLVTELGEAPRAVEVTPDAADGTVELFLAPGSPLIATFAGDPDPGTLPPLTITLDDGSPQPIGLLLPAVQKVREAAAHGDGTATHPAGTLSLTLEGAATVGGGVQVAAGDITGDGRDDAAMVFVVGTHAPGVAPAQRTAMADAFVAPTGIDVARFVPGASTALAVGELDIPDPYLLGRWSAAGAPMNLVVDVYMDGEVRTRFRVPRATPPATTQASAQGGARVVVFDGTTGSALTRDGNAERAMFDAGYATFSSDALDQAARVLQDYATAASMSLAIAQWTGERTQALADLVVATGAGGAPGYEAMACTAAIPTALAVANGLDRTRAENMSAAATAREAAMMVSPAVGMVAGGTLAMQAYGATAPAGDAELACAAVRQLASLPDSALTTEGQAIRALALELAAFDARHLEIELAAWIAAMDALVAAPDEGAWTAARAKADILVDSFSDAATRTQARWQLAAQLLGRAP